MRDKINFAPSEGRYKIYIIDEVHMLSIGAFNALLKTLEEPPAHAVFILATTESYKIPPTVVSRCQRFEFRRIPVAEIVARLKAQCVAEGLVVEEAAFELVARQATGSLRDAISLLDQLVASDATVTLAQAQALLGATASQTIQGLVEALAANDTAAALNLVNDAVDAGADARQLARQMVDYLRSLMLVRLGNAALVEATPEMKTIMDRQAERLDVPGLLRAVRAFNTAALDVRSGWQLQLPLELAIVECTTAAPAETPLSAGRGTVSPPHSPAAAPKPAVAPKAPAQPPAAAPVQPAVAAPAHSSETTPAPSSHPEPDAAPSTVNLRASWNRLLSLVREKDKATEALLRSCTVTGLEGNVLKLTTQVKLACEKINDHPQTHQLIADLLTDVMGFPCNVQCTLTGGHSAAGSRGPAGAHDGADERSAKTKHRPPDSLVATALRDLGGELVED